MSTISSLYQVPLVHGFRVGVEVEVELDRNAPFDTWPEVVGWRRDDNEGSIINGMEYLSASPRNMGILNQHLNTLTKALLRREITLANSDRCAVHVHFNVSNLSPDKVKDILALYYAAEPILLRFFDDRRLGNHFCVDLLRSPELAFQANAEIGARLLRKETWKYACLNPETICRFGTLEFRGMATPSLRDFEKIRTLCAMLQSIYSKGLTLERVSDWLLGASSNGYEPVLCELLGLDNLKQVERRHPDIVELCKRSSRLAQPLFYKD